MTHLLDGGARRGHALGQQVPHRRHEWSKIGLDEEPERIFFGLFFVSCGRTRGAVCSSPPPPPTRGETRWCARPGRAPRPSSPMCCYAHAVPSDWLLTNMRSDPEARPVQADFLAEDRLAEFNEAFDLFDKKKEKRIPSGDLITVFQAMKCNISKKEEQEFMQMLDPHGEGQIAHEGLLQLVAKRLETKETTEQLLQAFRVFDQQLQGTIKPEELRHILCTFGEAMDASEVDEHLAEAESKCPDLKANGDKTGKVNYVAYIGVMLDLSDEEVMAAGLGATQ